MLDGLEYDIQLLFSRFLGWLLLLFHTVIVAGISLRVVMKRRPIGVSLAWLALIYAIPFAGVGFYVLFGEIRLGRKRAGTRPGHVPPLRHLDPPARPPLSPALLRGGQQGASAP